jgi:hypothetical protein
MIVCIIVMLEPRVASERVISLVFIEPYCKKSEELHCVHFSSWMSPHTLLPTLQVFYLIHIRLLRNLIRNFSTI